MPSVPVMTMAPQNRSHQALISAPRMLNLPACKSGIARSASLAHAGVAVNRRTRTDQKISFKFFIGTMSGEHSRLLGLTRVKAGPRCKAGRADEYGIKIDTAARQVYRRRKLRNGAKTCRLCRYFRPPRFGCSA